MSEAMEHPVKGSTTTDPITTPAESAAGVIAALHASLADARASRDRALECANREVERRRNAEAEVEKLRRALSGEAGFLAAQRLAAGSGFASALNQFSQECHRRSVAAGWWNPALNDSYNIPTKLCLIHSEISEAMEGYRKGKMDDHLPFRGAIEVELADAMIRIGDLAAGLNLDLGGAIDEKMAYNLKRDDHKPEHRLNAEDGKRF